MTNSKITVIKGDGIGPEVVDSALSVLNAVSFKADFIEAEAGLAAWKKYGTPLPEKTVQSVLESDSCLFGSVTTPFGIKNYSSPIVALRKKLDLYANLRPIKSFEGVDSVKKINLFIVRENTEGLYSGIEEEFEDRVHAIRVVSRKASERIVLFAFALARKRNLNRVTVVHKANILRKSDGLFRDTALEVHKSFPDIIMDEMIVDAMAMDLIRQPEKYEVIVTTNLFGDILSDEAGQIAGSFALSPSGNIGDKNSVFEPVHGSAPDIAGKDKANPVAAILAAKMLLEHLNENEKALKIENAVEAYLRNGKKLTADLKGTATTKQATEEIISLL